jgi:hypothetical protein
VKKSEKTTLFNTAIFYKNKVAGKYLPAEYAFLRLSPNMVSDFSSPDHSRQCHMALQPAPAQVLELLRARVLALEWV